MNFIFIRVVTIFFPEQLKDSQTFFDGYFIFVNHKPMAKEDFFVVFFKLQYDTVFIGLRLWITTTGSDKQWFVFMVSYYEL